MNTLSWFLYFGDVVGNLQPVIIVPCVIYWVYLAILSLFEEKNHMMSALWTMPFLLIAALIPSTNTIYLIAASELGETAIISDEGKEMYDRIERYIDLHIQQIEDSVK